jgi:hypothetical protein
MRILSQLKQRSYQLFNYETCLCYTVCPERRCALRLRYVDLIVSIEVAIEVCCCFTVFSC